MITKILVFLIFLVTIFNSNLFSQKRGVERWSVKTLSDNRPIDTNYIETTIHDLNLIPPPDKIYYNTTRLKLEEQTFAITCKVIEIRTEKDGDLHLIVADTSAPFETMIFEIIKPSQASTQYYKQLKKVRDKIVYLRSKKKLIGKTFTFVGVAFYDLPHNQKGKSLSNLELHPVLKILP